MVKKIIDYVKTLIVDKKSLENKTNIEAPTHTRKEIIDSLDYDKYNAPEITCGTPGTNIFILDDIPDSLTLYDIDFSTIKRQYKKNVCNDFQVINCVGSTAGFKAHKFIAIEKNKIDYAILDITLGYLVRLDNGEYIEFDGIDIAIDILGVNPDAKIRFSTAHTLNKRNPTMEYYHNKFTKLTGKKLQNYYFNKNDNRAEKIYQFLYGE